MECDICLEKFDHSLNKPLVLIRCAHTLCSKCVKNLAENKCPSCNSVIEETKTNWSILKTASDSEYDKVKLELEKTLNEIESSEKKLYETKEKRIDENTHKAKIVKTQVEKQANDLIKLINENKKRLFKEIETNTKNLNKKIADLALCSHEKREEIKESLDKNDFEKEQMTCLKSELIKHKPEFNTKVDKINKFAESFEFVLNDKTTIGDDFIGEVKQITNPVMISKSLVNINKKIPPVIHFNQFKKTNLSKSFEPECCLYGMKCACTSTILKLTCDFLKNGDLVTACVFEERGLYLFIFSPDFKKQKFSENLDELDMRLNLSSFKVFADKFVFLAENRMSKKSELFLYNENLKLLRQNEVKNQALIGCNESFIFAYSTPKKQESNVFQIILYNWSLKAVKTIGQRESSEKPYYFSQKISSLEITDGKFYFLEYRSGNHYLQIIDESTGVLVRSVEVGEDAFELKVDSDGNVVVFNEEYKSVCFYNLDGDLLKSEVELKDFPAIAPKFSFDFDGLFAFDKKNNLHFFDPNSLCLYYQNAKQ